MSTTTTTSNNATNNNEDKSQAPKCYSRERDGKNGKLSYLLIRYKKADGSWTTKDVPVAIQSETEALKWFADWQKEKANQAPPPPEVKSMKTLAPIWFAQLDAGRTKRKSTKPIAPQTAADWKRAITNEILTHAWAEDNLLKGFDPAKAIAWLRDLRRSGRSASGISNIYRAVKLMIDDLCDGTNLPLDFVNPFSLRCVTKETPKVEAPEEDDILVLTHEQVQTLLSFEGEAIPLFRKVRYVLAFLGGFRDSEMQGAKFSDINWKEKTIRIERTIERYGEDRGKEKTTKTDETRSVPLHSLTLRALRLWEEMGFEQYAGRKPQTNDYLFPSGMKRKKPSDGKSYLPDFAKLIREDLATVGLPIRFVNGELFDMKTSRATFRTLLTSASVEEVICDRLMGHRRKGVGNRHYNKVSPERMQKAIACLTFDELPWLGVKESARAA
jgi:integrase